MWLRFKAIKKKVSIPTIFTSILLEMVFILWTSNLYGQTQEKKNIYIKGAIKGGDIKHDTVSFFNDLINEKYYENPLLKSEVKDNVFEFTTSPTYPHMYMNVLASDKGTLIWREGRVFIDEKTDHILLDYDYGECSRINGSAAEEYQHQFIPFLTDDNGETHGCKEAIMDGVFIDKGEKIDSLLISYINQHADSYVALWFLIERFSRFGHTELRERALSSFLPALKKSYIWNLLQEDMENAVIKTGKSFPKLKLKGPDLKAKELRLPEAQYTLIDFWFSRCIPCLKSYPKLKEIYEKYHKKGFEIIGISVDLTKYISLWQERIAEHGLIWPQYLDENEENAKRIAIREYPSYILLDKHGKIIKRIDSLEELEEFLSVSLN